MAALSVNIPSGATKDIQEINVSQEDQLNINKFARESLRLNELAEEVKEKEVPVQLPCVAKCLAYLVSEHNMLTSSLSLYSVCVP